MKVPCTVCESSVWEGLSGCGLPSTVDNMKSVVVVTLQNTVLAGPSTGQITLTFSHRLHVLPAFWSKCVIVELNCHRS